MTETELIAALKRASSLIGWMSRYIGQRAPGEYKKCYTDLNEHLIFMAKLYYEELAAEDKNDRRDSRAEVSNKC